MEFSFSLTSILLLVTGFDGVYNNDEYSDRGLAHVYTLF